ncbi:hypothetical protein [Paenibacillus sp. ISL-20]|uniref:hypothetical protein n=1 Tax=Paenibacillus sp. ISL-20 TaxID=2819163 RepID=UPI001BE74025|nr:hypothetical protein [Paenibacillus sp. ISL-20]MBT2761881.1 hypothetical protein [Paenibacillus sp. ISL-20]
MSKTSKKKSGLKMGKFELTEDAKGFTTRLCVFTEYSPTKVSKAFNIPEATTRYRVNKYKNDLDTGLKELAVYIEIFPIEIREILLRCIENDIRERFKI